MLSGDQRMPGAVTPDGTDERRLRQGFPYLHSVNRGEKSGLLLTFVPRSARHSASLVARKLYATTSESRAQRTSRARRSSEREKPR